MNYRQMNTDCHKKLVAKLKLLKKELKELSEDNAYKKIWIEEINELFPIIMKGIKEGFYREDETLFK